jgi:hypothetical protein
MRAVEVRVVAASAQRILFFIVAEAGEPELITGGRGQSSIS